METAIELMTGCLDVFAYGGYDVMLQRKSSPVPGDRKLHRKRWYLYRFGKYAGHSFKTSKEAMSFIDKERQS